MPQNPNFNFDQMVLEMIEHSPVGAVPVTPAYQDALARLYASHQVYVSADHKDGHVTAHSLSQVRSFYASNLDALIAGQITGEQLETNSSIFDRYVQSLPTARHAKAENYRTLVAGRAILHRAKIGIAIHDPIHSLFMVPGTGPHHGLPGNYLYGSAIQLDADRASSRWAVQLHDVDDGAASFDASTMNEALSKIKELVECAPFNMNELEALGFKLL